MADATTDSGELSPLERLITVAEIIGRVKSGMVLHSPDGRIIDLNGAAARILGVDRDGLDSAVTDLGRWKPVRQDGSAMPPDELPAAITLATGVECTDVIMGIDVPGRPQVWLSVDSYQLLSDDHVVGVVSVFDDISHMYKEMRMREVLMGAMKAVIDSNDEEESLQGFCDSLLGFGRLALVGIGFMGPVAEGSRIEFEHMAGATGYFEEAAITWSAEGASGLGLAGTSMRTRSTQVSQVLKSDPQLAAWWELARKYGLESSLTIPIAVNGRDAVLVLCSTHEFAFDEQTIRGLEAIAEELEFGLSHVESIQNLAKALDGTISAFSSVTEIRDPYTAGHQANVGRLGKAIAEMLDLDPSLADLVRKGGELHDVGKIAIPAEVLVRPGALSAIEFEMVKQHTTVGARILAEASIPWPIPEIALQHHERMDGSGYPSGLQGADIPMPSRIIAVADVVEAMTHHRPYRVALGIDSALAYVDENAGTLFDADVVRACHAAFDAGFSFPVKFGASED
jgi:putative nucleotidyltransferase with HDIG domain